MIASPQARPAAHWRPRLTPTQLGATERRWLSDEGSLTARLRAHSRHFTVQLLRQQLLLPALDECAPLQLRPGQLAWGREVVLLADHQPRIYARSLLPRRHARGPWQMFAGVGNRSLGAVLFADPGIARQPLNFRRLDQRHPLYRAALAASGLPAAAAPQLWARRSLFCRQGHALMVCEVFLPAAFEL